MKQPEHVHAHKTQSGKIHAINHLSGPLPQNEELKEEKELAKIENKPIKIMCIFLTETQQRNRTVADDLHTVVSES